MCIVEKLVPLSISGKLDRGSADSFLVVYSLDSFLINCGLPETLKLTKLSGCLYLMPNRVILLMLLYRSI